MNLLRQSVSALLLAAATVLVSPAIVAAQAFDPLPFPVKIGGKDVPKAAGEANHVKLAEAVAADAEIVVSDVTGQVIANIFPSKPDGTPVEGAAQPVVLMFEAGKPGSFAKRTMGDALKPGLYLMNLVAGGRTARIMFEVK